MVSFSSSTVCRKIIRRKSNPFQQEVHPTGRSDYQTKDKGLAS